MSDTKEARETDEEQKQSLPVGHPQAGYYPSDPTANDEGIGTLPPVEQEWKDDQVQAYEEQVDAVVESEHAVATAPPEVPPETEEDVKSSSKSPKATPSTSV